MDDFLTLLYWPYLNSSNKVNQDKKASLREREREREREGEREREREIIQFPALFPTCTQKHKIDFQRLQESARK